MILALFQRPYPSFSNQPNGSSQPGLCLPNMHRPVSESGPLFFAEFKCIHYRTRLFCFPRAFGRSENHASCSLTNLSCTGGCHTNECAAHMKHTSVSYTVTPVQSPSPRVHARHNGENEEPAKITYSKIAFVKRACNSCGRERKSSQVSTHRLAVSRLR